MYPLVDKLSNEIESYSDVYSKLGLINIMFNLFRKNYPITYIFIRKLGI